MPMDSDAVAEDADLRALSRLERRESGRLFFFCIQCRRILSRSEAAMLAEEPSVGATTKANCFDIAHPFLVANLVVLEHYISHF
jgi:hypothetical protein